MDGQEVDSDKIEYFKWIVKAVPIDQLLNIAKNMAMDFYYIEKAKKVDPKTGGPLSSEPMPEDTQNEILFGFSDLEHFNLIFAMELNIKNVEFKLSNNDGD